MNRKYLDDIGCTSRWDNNWGDKKRDKRAGKWLEQRREFGFDERITWNLGNSLIEDIYERLMMYMEIGGKKVDLTFNKFDYNGKEYTQEELINRAIEDCKRLLSEDFDIFGNYEAMLKRQKEGRDLEREVFDILYIVLPALWW